MQTDFYSNGKLLLSGEYAILDGAKGIALPTTFGQSLLTKPISENEIQWLSYDADKSLWFSANFNLADFDILNTSETSVATTLKKIHKQPRIKS